jgi:hypothetical protein
MYIDVYYTANSRNGILHTELSHKVLTTGHASWLPAEASKQQCKEAAGVERCSGQSVSSKALHTELYSALLTVGMEC